jgi:TctA family transporter
MQQGALFSSPCCVRVIAFGGVGAVVVVFAFVALALYALCLYLCFLAPLVFLVLLDALIIFADSKKKLS